MSARREAGFSLVMMVMVVTVLSIGLAAALPKWSEMIKRDKEEELISRGWQYVEAIRVFQRRYQRYPTTLDELIKVKPRCIRQLWKDPMTANGKWTPIFLGQGAGLTPLNSANPSVPGTTAPTPPTTGPVPGQPSMTTGTGTLGTDNTVPGNGLDPDGQEIAAGPIIGVKSRSTAQSLLVFYGHEHYNEWEFRIELLTRGRPPGSIGIPGGGPVLSTRWLGRPIESFAPTGNGLAPSSLGPGAFPSGGAAPPASPAPVASPPGNAAVPPE